MTLNSIFKGALPVVIGVIAAGFLLNALRDIDFFNSAIGGFDR